MMTYLNPVQLNLLRRCHGGLRVWETGPALDELRAKLDVLCRLRLVSFDHERGYELTEDGYESLTRLSG